MTTPPTPDAGEPEVIRTLRQEVRDGNVFLHDKHNEVVCATAVILQAYDALTAQLAAANADGAEARSVVTAMRRYMPTPGENPGETRISLREWEPLMQRIESLDAARTGAR